MSRRPKKTERDPAQAVLYLRVSTEEQATLGLSLEAQKRTLTTYCESHGLSIVETYLDAGQSATTDARPDFRRMMGDILSPDSLVGRLLVVHPTRFMRDAHLAAVYRAKLKKAGIELVATQQPDSDGPIGELMNHLMDGIAQFESQTIGIRARAGMEESARSGFYPHASAPYGFRIQKVDFQGRRRNQLSACPEESATVRQIFSLYLGGLGGQAIAQHLNLLGTLRRGSRWCRDSVLKVLSDSAVRGIVVWGKREARTGRLRPESDWIRIEVEPIVDTTTFDKVRDLREQRDPAKNPGRSSSTPLLLGGGVARCGHCGSSLELQTSGKKRPDGSRYEYYQCAKVHREGRSACPCCPIAVDDLEAEVMLQVAARAFSEKRARRILERLCDGPLRDGREREIARVRRRVETLRLKKERLIDAVASGAMSACDVEEKVASIAAGVIQLEQELAALVVALPPKVISRKLVKRLVRWGTKALATKPEIRSAYRQSAVRRIVVKPRGGRADHLRREPEVG